MFAGAISCHGVCVFPVKAVVGLHSGGMKGDVVVPVVAIVVFQV